MEQELTTVYPEGCSLTSLVRQTADAYIGKHQQFARERQSVGGRRKTNCKMNVCFQMQAQELERLEEEKLRILGRLQQPRPPALKSVVTIPAGTTGHANCF